MQEGDMVLVELFRDHLPFFSDDSSLSIHEVFDRQVLFERVIDPKQAALPQARKIQGSFPQRLRRDSPGINTGAAQVRLALDQRDALAILSGFCCALFSRRSGADDDEIKFFCQICLSKYSSK